MNIIFMSLTLFIPTVSVLAGPTDDYNNVPKSQHSDPNLFERVQPQPEPIYDEQPRYLKLIQTIEGEQRLKTFRV